MAATIEEINEVIALFMGWTKSPYPNLPNKLYKDNFAIHKRNLLYHSDWNWLMTVIEKIESLFNGGIQFYIKDKRAYIETDTQVSLIGEMPDVPDCYSGFCDSKKDAVYKTVYLFIQWYNTLTPSPEAAGNDV